MTNRGEGGRGCDRCLAPHVLAVVAMIAIVGPCGPFVDGRPSIAYSGANSSLHLNALPLTTAEVLEKLR